ncbi:MAG: peptidoglycan-associated lipoprotein Pal [Betaproteobacteria bacterium]|nr:MAG: peptidoglycan-associated lipoprotein Pal [Betaproteobacteria bacterium]
MKSAQKSTLALLAATVLGVLALSGCSSTPDTPAAVTEGSRTGATTGATGTRGADTSGLPAGTNRMPATVQPATESNNSTATSRIDPALTDPRSPLSQRSIFYDYDSFVVKDEFKTMVDAHAAYLKRNPGARLVIEGNTDERGSREYNLALGQKRAEGVKRVFALLGVNESQVQTVSFGEEKPRNPAATEGAYSENRRCDLRYAGE